MSRCFIVFLFLLGSHHVFGLPFEHQANGNQTIHFSTIEISQKIASTNGRTTFRFKSLPRVGFILGGEAQVGRLFTMGYQENQPINFQVNSLGVLFRLNTSVALTAKVDCYRQWVGSKQGVYLPIGLEYSF